MIKIKKGLDLPIAGEPKQEILDGPPVRSVALVAADYIGMKPTMVVRDGDTVKLGQLLFTDKRNPSVQYTAPGAGTVTAIHRGAKRSFQSIEIALSGNAEETFESYAGRDLTGLSRDEVTRNLLNSGLWTALRKRPFSKVPSPETPPHSIFVTAMDTHPLAVNPELVIRENEPAFIYGLQALSRLTDGKVYVCKAPGAAVPGGDVASVHVEEFDGPHPAGLPGTHIHHLDPVDSHKSVWFINYQDVIAVGKLFATGRLSVDRVISIGGPAVTQPRIVRTRLGASISDLTAGLLEPGELRVISGSVLSGRGVTGVYAYLGRYHLQISALPEGAERKFLGWQTPGFEKFSTTRVFASSLLMNPARRFRFTTSREGSSRAMVPIGTYEKVMPIDTQPTFLLRALIVGDTEQAQKLGALELDEEDVALCTFVCPGKYEYGPILRQNLEIIEKEG